MIRSICISCRKPYIKNPRQKNQKYCNAPACQKARKAKWQRDKMKTSLKYRKDQQQANRDWRDKRPDYWKSYRKKNPKKDLRNKLLQIKRNQSRSSKKAGKTIGYDSSPKTIAKMDVLKANNHAFFAECWVIPVIAKMDVLKGYLTVNFDDKEQLNPSFLDCKDGRHSYSGDG